MYLNKKQIDLNKNDIIGQKFTKLTVREQSMERGDFGDIMYHCKCDCGNWKIVSRGGLLHGKNKSCGCLRIDRKSKVGKKIGMLTILKILPIKHLGKYRQYQCRCECGKIINVTDKSLRQKKNISCGCVKHIRKRLPVVQERVEKLIGQKYAMLKIIEEVPCKEKTQKLTFRCKCDCGEETITTLYRLQHGYVRSCGCLHKIKNREYAIIKNRYLKLLETHRRIRHCKIDDNTISFDTYMVLIKQPCHYCGIKYGNLAKDRIVNKNTKNRISKIEVKYNGIDRIDNNRGYVYDNCVPCCKTCNFAKRKMTLQQFCKWVNNIYNNLDKRQKRQATKCSNLQLSLWT